MSPTYLTERNVHGNTNPRQERMKTELGELIAQLQLSELQKGFLRSRWLDQVLWMGTKAGQVQSHYYTLRLIAIIGEVIVLTLVGLNFTSPTNEIASGATIFLGLAVAISVAVEEFFNYGERW